MSQRFGRSQRGRGAAPAAEEEEPRSGGGGVDGAQMQLHSRLNAIRGDMYGIKEVIEKIIHACTVTATDLEEIDETDSVSEVDQSLRQLLDAQHRLEVEEKLLASLCSSSENADPETEYVRGWEKSERQYSALSDAAKYGANEKYREFRQQVWDVKHDGEAMPPLFGEAGGEASDEELVIAGARMTYKCPITTTWLNDPVTSKTCKHSYTKQAIMDYLKAQRGECACPVGGCSRRVRAADLFEDKVLERKIARHLRQLEAEESAATYTMVQ
ncbi:hypothetical protein GGI00_000857 [Coemansia sp. RSA 2681]|nr:hypothetical protein GGI00_000857 [Coemansia sp. RSA 2681]